MKCSNCGSENDSNTKFCTNCGNKLDANVTTTETTAVTSEGSGIGWGFLGFFIPLVGIILFFAWKNDKPKGSKAAGIGALISIVLSILVYAILFFVIGIGALSFSSIGTPDYTGTSTTTNSESNTTNEKIYTIGDKFEVYQYKEKYEISIGTTYSIETFSDEYSDLNGKQVVKMPITIKNLGTSSSHMISSYVKYYGPDGNEITTDFSYEYDDGIGMAGDLLSGSSYTKNIYFEYKGAGNYTVEFEGYKDDSDNYEEVRKTVKFKINE